MISLWKCFLFLAADRDRRLATRIPKGATAGGDPVLDYDSMHSSSQMRGLYTGTGMAPLGTRKMSSSRDKDAFPLPESTRSPSRHQRITKWRENTHASKDFFQHGTGWLVVGGCFEVQLTEVRDFSFFLYLIKVEYDSLATKHGLSIGGHLSPWL